MSHTNPQGKPAGGTRHSRPGPAICRALGSLPRMAASLLLLLASSCSPASSVAPAVRVHAPACVIELPLETLDPADTTLRGLHVYQIRDSVLIATSAVGAPLPPDGEPAKVLRILRCSSEISGLPPTIRTAQSRLRSSPLMLELDGRPWCAAGEDREVWLRPVDDPERRIHLAWRPADDERPDHGEPHWLQSVSGASDTIWVACVVMWWRPTVHLCLWRLDADSRIAHEVGAHAVLGAEESRLFVLYGLLRDPQGGLRAVLGTLQPDWPDDWALRITAPLQDASEIRFAGPAETSLPVRTGMPADKIPGTPINWDSCAPKCVPFTDGFVVAWSSRTGDTGPARMVAQIYQWEHLDAPRTIVLDTDEAGMIWGHHAFGEPDGSVSVIWRRVTGEGTAGVLLAHLDRETLEGAERTSANRDLGVRWTWPDTSGRVEGDASSGWLITWNHAVATVRFERVSALLQPR